MNRLLNILRPNEKSDRVPIILAPMAGITDSVFRSLCIEQGCDFTFTEMISAKGLHYKSAKTRELLRISPSERPCGVQLFGHESDILAEQIKSIYEAAEGDIAVFDINMGCPAPKITGNGDGSALMKNPVLAGKIIEAAVKSSPVPVSIKFRKGWDENSVNAVEFARMAENSGASFITLHGRTREQMYSGKADWDIIAEVVSKVNIPVIGNGDIFSGADAVGMLEKTHCAGLMAARGTQGNPFIFAEIRAALDNKDYIFPTDEERMDAALRHLTEYMAQHDAGAFINMRKHLAWYTKGLKGGAEFRRKVNSCANADELTALTEEFKKTVKNRQ